MISQQRQQKKNARYKKKVPGGGKGQYNGEKKEETPKENSSTTSVSNIDDAPTLQSMKTEIKDDQDFATENKYSKRKVMSNADRYREIDDNEYQVETDEQLQARLVQLLNIPTVRTATLPVFEDEPDSSHEHPPSFLALDCNALVRALESIPIHKKLDIDIALMELDDQSYDSSSTASEVVQSTQKPEQKNNLLLPEFVLKRSKPEFQFQLPTSAKTSEGYNHTPPRQGSTLSTASIQKTREEKVPDTVSTHRTMLTVGCGISPPFLAVPNSEAPLNHSSQASELDNALDAILAL